MKLAVLSDTHGLVRPEVVDVIRECDGIIHAGDITSQSILDELAAVSEKAGKYVPFYVVRGNNDRGSWARALPKTLEFELDRVRFFLVHDKKDIPDQLKDVEIVIYGHSHKYACEERAGQLWLNPGSCGRRRFRQDITMAVLTLEGGTWRVERKEFFPEQRRVLREKMSAELSNDLIREIMARMDRGQTVDAIGEKMKLDREFVAEICRIRVTHQGVTAEGIFNKIEANGVGRKHDTEPK